MIDIYRAGNVVISVHPSDNDKLTKKVMGENTIVLSFDLTSFYEFLVGDYLFFSGEKYTLNVFPSYKKLAENLFTYDLLFEGIGYELRKVNFRYYTANLDYVGGAVFSLMGDAELHARIIVENLNRTQSGWMLGEVIESSPKNLSFSNESCLTAITKIAQEFGTEYWIGTGKTVNIGKRGDILPLILQYGLGNGLYDIERSNVNSKDIITRLYPYGSSQNLPKGYRNNAKNLEVSTSYIERNTSQYGIIEKSEPFEDIKPERVGTITAIGGDIYSFIDSSMDFDLNATNRGNTLYLIAGTTAKIHFQTGDLAGYEFELLTYIHGSKTFIIKKFTNEVAYDLPNVTLKPRIGDQYIILDIYMPQSYVDAAEARLLAKAQEFLNQNSEPNIAYKVAVDPLFIQDLGITFKVGDYISIADSQLGIDRDIRIVGLSRNINNPDIYDFDLADTVEPSLTSQIMTQLDEQDIVIKLNRLNDPARARRSWKVTQELQDAIFDQDGYFDNTNIKPFSIQTNMLTVGSKGTQFFTNCYFQANYGGNKNNIVVGNGSLSHFTIEDSIRNWTITGLTETLPDDNIRYIFIKCLKANTAGQVVLSATQLSIDDGTYYNFFAGVLSSVIDNARQVSLLFGFTSINGRFIKTGRIVSGAGTDRYIDIDTGEIQGSFKFTNGTDVQTSVGTAQSTANNAATSASTAQTAANNATDIARAMQYGKMLYRDPLFNVGVNGINLYNNSGGSNLLLERITAISDSPNSGYNIRITTVSPFSISPGLGGFYFATTARANAVFITRIVAKIPVGYTINFASNATGNNTVSKWLTTQQGTGRFEEYSFYLKCGDSGSFSSSNFFYLSGTTAAIQWYLAFASVYDLTDSDITTIDSKSRHFIAQPVTPYYISDTWSNGTTLYRCKTTRTTGSYNAADWELATTFDNTATTIQAGLVTTGTVQVGSGDGSGVYVKAGITGQGDADSSVRIWAGSSFVNRAVAPYRVLQNGDFFSSKGSIAGWQLDSDKIIKQDGDYSVEFSSANRSLKFKFQGDDKVQILGDNIPPLSELITPSTGTVYPGANKLETNSITSSYLAPNSITVPNSRITLTTKLSFTGRGCNTDIEAFLCDTAGTKIKSLGILIITIGNLEGWLQNSPYTWVINANGMTAGTYKIKYDYTLEFSDTPETFTIGGASSSDNSIYYSQLISGTVLGKNGISTFFDANKYFYLSQDATNFLQAKGKMLLYSPNGLRNLSVLDDAVKISRLNLQGMILNLVTKSANYTITASDKAIAGIKIIGGTSDQTIALPSLNDYETVDGSNFYYNDNRPLLIMNSTRYFAVTAASNQTVAGVTTLSINRTNTGYIFVGDRASSNWMVLGIG